jgi:predicted ATP-grasp superfamily ATP-dependent carboligase
MLGHSLPQPDQLGGYLGVLPLRKAVLFPCSDDWTRAVAALPDSTREHFNASICSLQTIETMTDKWRFAQMLEHQKVDRPATTAIQSLAELSALPEAAFENMFLKPLDSQEFSVRTGKKAFRLEGRSHALEIMTQVDGTGKGFPILLQEYVPGPASSYFLVDGIVDRHGQTLARFARQRHRMYPAPFGNSTLSETIPLTRVQPAIESLDRIFSATGYRGIFDAEFKYDKRDGKFKIVEINARPWWFVEFASRCGMNLCEMAYRDALGLPAEPTATYSTGRSCVYMLYDFPAHQQEQPGVRSLFRWINCVRRSDEIVYCRDDPRPGIFLIIHTLQKILTRGVKRLRFTRHTSSPERQKKTRARVVYH